MAKNENTGIDDLELSDLIKRKLKAAGYISLADFHGIHFPDIFAILSFDQSKDLLKYLLSGRVDVGFSKPSWDEKQWHSFVEEMVARGIVDWKEIAMAVCGELNPPQVGTAIASNASFQKHFPPRETMKNVMAWLYTQNGKCSVCGTRLFLEADHIKSKQAYAEEGKDPEDADRLENLQLLCKRCNVIKRPSHTLGGISFAPAQSVLIWILLSEKPATRDDFYTLCRHHGLTMASVRFDEAWAFAEWLKKEGRYP
jgi:hypothetical protein